MLRILQTRVISGLRSQCTKALSTGPTDTPVYDNAEDDKASNPRRRGERCLNRVTLIGRVGKDPDHRGNEHPAVIFPLATNATYRKANGELMTRTDWHRICVFRPGLRDNVASRIKRSDRLFIEGSLSYVRYTDDSGTNTNITSVIADDIVFLGGNQKQNQADDGDL